MSSDSVPKSGRAGSGRRSGRRCKAVSALGGARESTAKTLVRRLWFAVLNFAESYKLQTLAAIFFWMFVVWIIGTNVVYLCEQCLPPELRCQSPYCESYFDAYWWVVLTITGAGVEDAAKPESLAARVAAVVLLIIGICLVAILTGNVVAILWEKIARRDLMRMKPRIAHVAQYSGHIVICNASAKFEPILRQIVDKVGADTKIVLVDPKADEYRTDRRLLFRSTFAVAGSPQHLRSLKQADVATAAALVVLTPDAPGLSLQERDYQALLTALAVQPVAEVNPDLRIILEVNLQSTLEFARIFNSLDNYPLYIEAVCGDDFQERLISQACLTHGLSNFFDLLLTVPPRATRRSAITRFFDTVFLREVEAMATAAGQVDTSNDIYAIPLAEQFEGKTFREVRQTIEEADGVTVIGYLQWEGNGEGVGVNKPAVTLNPSRKPSAPGRPAPIDYRLTLDDELFVIARPEACLALQEGRYNSPTPSLAEPGSHPKE